MSIFSLDFAQSLETQEKQSESKLRQSLVYKPDDFEVWLELIKEVEKYSSPEKNKSIYQEFLEEFPQYYPVWRKLAEAYNALEDYEMVACTYEEGLKYLPVSVDLWLHYCIWKASRGPQEEARSLYQKAVAACGKVYNSSILWDKYLDFEKSLKNYQNMEMVFSALMTFPTNKLYEYYTRFKNFLDQFGREILDYQTPEEYDQARKLKLEEIISNYEKAVIENNKRKPFEQSIKRSNFNPKPVDQEQLVNWRKYCEFEENEGEDLRIKLLYERCIVALCYYDEFWIRYARYLEKTQGVETAREVYQRGNKHFLFRKPYLFVSQGYFEELHGNTEEAKKLYKHVYEKVAPGLLNAVLKHINLERRNSNFTEVENLYQKALEVAENEGKPETIALIASHYGRFYQNIMKNPNKAIEVFESALEKAPGEKSLYLILVNAYKNSDRTQEITNVYEKAIWSTELPQRAKVEFWVGYIDFVRSTCEDKEKLREAEENFRLNFHHEDLLIEEFKKASGIKRMQRSASYEYPEPIKQQQLI